MDDDDLQREACALIKQYGSNPFFPQAAKQFFRRLADFLNWYDLQKALK